jgi:Ni2+-binding GTPase involved in maturation of urease and hydrogenase
VLVNGSSRKFTTADAIATVTGAGKTSVILSLLPKLPKDYKVVLLKVGSN